jgi:hypothetical protein
MDKLKLLKIFSEFDGEVSEGDYTPDEIVESLKDESEGKTQAEIREEYFELYDDVKDKVNGHEDW